MNELRAGTPVIIGERTIVPIERVTVLSDKVHHCSWFSGLKEPVAIVVIEPGGLRAIDMKACDLSINELARNVPDLDGILEGFCKAAEK